MKGFSQKDSVLKLISIVVAIILWFYVILVVDPSVDVTVRDIPLRYANQTVLEERGLSVVVDPDATVELKISGNRKKIANIDNKNIYATVDLANMNKVGTFAIPISISIPYEYDEIVSKKPYNASIVIDKIVEEEREVNIATEGSVANGYIAGTPEVSVSKVVLRGAESLVKKIQGVEVALDFDGRSDDIKDKEKIYFIGSNGKRINQNDYIYSAVSVDVDTVDIKCQVMKLKTVPVTVDTVSLGDEYKVTVQPANVTIYAENDILEEISEISAAAIDAEALATEGIQIVELVIPDDVSMRDGITEITVKAEKKN